MSRKEIQSYKRKLSRAGFRRVLASEKHKGEILGERPIGCAPERVPILEQRFHTHPAKSHEPPAQVFRIIELIKRKASVSRNGKVVSIGWKPRFMTFHAKHYRIAKAFMAKRAQLKVQKLMKVHSWTEEQARHFLATEKYPT